MKKNALLLLCLLLVRLSASGQSYTNPIYDLADPFLTFYNGYYYATGTTGGTVGLKRARTLQELKGAPTKTIFSPSSAAGAPRYAYWAPEIHRINGKWYCYFTANDVNNDVYQSCHVLETDGDDPYDATWTYAGRVYDPAADYYFIDATILQLNGELYMIYCGCEPDHVNHFPQRLYINKMASPTSLVSGRALLSSPTLSWEGNSVNEGPEVIVHGGKVFLAYSASGCWTPDYKIGLMEMTVGDDPMQAASWTKHPDPVFVGDAGVNVYAPGHHCFFKSPDGREDWFAYHATPESGGACDASRTVRAQRLYWKSDGTPDFGSVIKAGLFLTAPSGEPSTPSGEIANGVYEITCRATGQRIDLAAGSHSLNTNIQQYTANGGDAQKWAIQRQADGYYTITAVAGGLSMDVQNASNDNAANIQTYAPNGGDCQKWAFESVGDGYYKILSKQSGKALDINTSTGNLQQYEYLGGENQQFSLTLSGAAPQVTAPYVAYESYNMHANYMRHAYGVGKIDAYITGIDDAYWKMVPGLAGKGVSFQSRNYPDNYLRHSDGAVVLNTNDGSDLFAQDASFYAESGLANGMHASFRSVNYPTRHLRHRDGLLYCEEVSAGTGYEDATWIVMRPYYDHGSDRVTLYADINQSGDSYGLPEGGFTNADLFTRGVPRATVSSLNVTTGFRATLYSGNDLTGQNASYTTLTSYVGDDINDLTYSVNVEPWGAPGLSGYYKIKGRNSGKYWDCDGNGSSNDTHLVQWDDEGTERYQRWQLEETANGVYKIHNYGSPDKVVEIYNASTENRGLLQLYDDNGGNHQQFILVDKGDGYYQFVARNSGKVAELADNSTASGQLIQLWDNNNQACSWWALESVDLTSVNERNDCTASVYPNPATGFLHVRRKVSSGRSTLRILSLTGCALLTRTGGETDVTLDVRHLPQGVYLLEADGTITKWVKR